MSSFELEMKTLQEQLAQTTNVAEMKDIAKKICDLISLREDAKYARAQEYLQDMLALRRIQPLIEKRIKKVQKICPLCKADCKKINVVPASNGWKSFRLFCNNERCTNRYQGYDADDPNPFGGMDRYEIRIIWKENAEEENVFRSSVQITK